MINIEAKHYKIVQEILQKYDYDFFLFGSRATDRVKKFSDIDLFYIEVIPSKVIAKIEEDFEESDLPYKVDLVNYNKCDLDFQNIMKSYFIPIHSSSKTKIIETGHLDHFTALPELLGYETKEYNGVKLINCGLNSSMFNIVFGAPDCLEDDFSKCISDLIKRVNREPFAWWVPPSQHSPNFTKALIAAGLVAETKEYAMICDLQSFENRVVQLNLNIKAVLDSKSLDDFITVIEPYDKNARRFYEKLTKSHLELSNERLFCGYDHHGSAVVIAILCKGQNNSAGIFSLLTDEGQRGKGYGSSMMRYIMQYAKESDCEYVTLSASSDSGYKIYEALGFKTFGEFECFEYKGII